jgi:hypothetical protein
MREWMIVHDQYIPSEDEIVIQTTKGQRIILVEVEIIQDEYGMTYAGAKKPVYDWELERY